MNMGCPRTIQSIVITFAAISITLIGLLFFFFFHGVPLHDFRLWMLERGFKKADLYHPPESLLLQKKTYLGGHYTHGSLTCDFYVGELRTVPLSKEKIIQAYDGRLITSFGNSKQVPLKVLFFDEGRWNMSSPLGNWWDEWYQKPLTATSGTAYFVFVSQEGYPFLGDYRCDD